MEAMWGLGIDEAPKIVEIVNLLLQAGADVNAKSEDGTTVLMLAAYSKEPDVVNILLEAGADVNARDADGKTALHSAAAKGDPRIIRTLLQSGADVNAKVAGGFNVGMTPLIFARTPVAAKVLLDAGADIRPVHQPCKKGLKSYSLGYE